LRARFARCTLSSEEVNDLCVTISARPAPHKAGRLALRSRLIGLVRQKLRAAGRLEADQPWLDRELAASDELRSLLDRVWPSVSPTALVSELLTGAERLAQAAEGILSEKEWRSLLRAKGKRVGTQAWTLDDLALLDEAEYLINGRTRAYGHVVVDEAQDLSPMQFRMVTRRAPSGSVTILGDLAQATGAWSYGTWDEILRHLPTGAPSRHDELTLGYRAPGQILDLASKLLPEAAPTVQPTRSIRQGRREPRIMRVAPDALLSESVGEATGLADEGLLVGLVVSAGHLAAMTALVGERSDIGLLDRDGMHRRVTVVEATAAKGLEFDAVVVVEPAAIAGADDRGLRLLYVAMTRPIQHLSLLHAEPLPELLLP
jgi:DNA helicase IV